MIVDYIIHLDNEEILDELKSFVDYQKDEIVSHTISGQPLKKSTYILEIKEAEVQFNSGEIVAHEEVVKRANQW